MAVPKIGFEEMYRFSTVFQEPWPSMAYFPIELVNVGRFSSAGPNRDWSCFRVDMTHSHALETAFYRAILVNV